MTIFDAVRTGDLEVVKTYLKYGGAVDNTINTGSTLLMIASSYGQTEVIKLLIGAGADVNAVSYDGMTALMYAMTPMGNIDCVKLLIEAGADVNASFSRSITAGETPLMFAAEANLEEAVNLLLESGADINAKDNSGKTALNRVSEIGHAGIMEILKSAGAGE